MSVITARQTASVSAGTAVTAALLSVGAFLLMSLMHYPGLIKLAGVLAVTFGTIARVAWQEPASVSRSAHVAGPLALAGTALVALVWPALPWEQVATVSIVAGAALAHSVNVELVRWHARRVGR